MKKVLARAVRCGDGVEYPEGTPIEDCPEENRESIIGSGWTKYASDEGESPEARGASGEEDSEQPEGQHESQDESADSASTESAESESEQSEDAGEQRTDAGSDSESSSEARGASGEEEKHQEDPRILDLAISDDLKTKLINAGIETVQQARKHLEQHGSFRTIHGIGKAGNQQINEAIG